MELLPRVLGLVAEPAISPPLLHFHSFRKIAEGNPQISDLLDGARMGDRRPSFHDTMTPVSGFKMKLIRGGQPGDVKQDARHVLFFEAYRSKVGEETARQQVEQQFRSTHSLWTGGSDELRFGSGLWLERMDAKPLMNVLFSNQFMVCKDQAGTMLRGDPLRKAVGRRIMKLQDSALPPDFVSLREMLKQHIASSKN